MIYLITNTVNGKRYIGKTSRTIEVRWYHHCKNAEYGLDNYLYKAIRKYGKDNFTIEYLCDGLDEEEVVMIEAYSPEYNMTKGGDGGDTSNSPRYQEGMIRRRSYKGENNPNYGKCGELSPKYGKKYGPKPNISRSKMKKLLSSDNNIFEGFQSMFDFYNVKSYYSLKKKGITWSEI
jgi:group I intron endonuclease